MSPIDLYIKRATIGLPRRTKLDTAAELRVHLNERATTLTSQGLDRSEAEHLAVEYMGPIEPVNRELLGHAFTARVGWVLVILLLVGIAAWFGRNYLFAPAEVASARPTGMEDLLPLLGDFASVDVTVPRGAHSMSLALGQGGVEVFSSISGLLGGFDALRPNERRSFGITMGFPIAAIARMECGVGSRPIFVSSNGGDTGGRIFGCVEVAGNSGSWYQPAAGGLDVVYDKWQPLLVYIPATQPDYSALAATGTPPESTDWDPAQADPSGWLVLSVFTSRAPIQDLGPLPSPPTGAELLGLYPWLLR